MCVSSCVCADYDALEVISNSNDLSQLTVSVVMKLDLKIPSRVRLG